MASPKTKNKSQREAHLNEVAKLLCRGLNNCEIARQLGVHESQIRYDVKIISERWEKRYTEELQEVKMHAVETIAETIRQSWQEWENSGNGFIRESSSEKGATVTKESSYRDPRYLAIVQNGIDKICKILGLNAPVKVSPVNPDGKSPATFVVALPEKIESVEEWNALNEIDDNSNQEVQQYEH